MKKIILIALFSLVPVFAVEPVNSEDQTETTEQTTETETSTDDPCSDPNLQGLPLFGCETTETEEPVDEAPVDGPVVADEESSEPEVNTEAPAPLEAPVIEDSSIDEEAIQEDEPVEVAETPESPIMPVEQEQMDPPVAEEEEVVVAEEEIELPQPPMEAFSPMAGLFDYIYPCGIEEKGAEVLIRIGGGDIVGYMENEGKGHLTKLPSGKYKTTDSHQCRFEITESGEINLL